MSELLDYSEYFALDGYEEFKSKIEIKDGIIPDPNAPVDPATGLEKPTIAIGGNKGVSSSTIFQQLT